jgi:outer membrane protein assembly factor BamB
MSNRTMTCLAMAVVGVGPLVGATSDWPQFRGPLRDGKSAETGLLKAWPEGGPKLEWTARGLGGGYASVSVAGDLIVTAGDRADGVYVVALRRSDGKPAWSGKLGQSGAPGWGGFSGPRCTPSVAGDRVFAIGQFGEFACFDANSGKELWRKNLVTDFGGVRPEWGFSESPLVDGENVVCTPGGAKGAMVALDQRTGAVVWRCVEFKDAAAYSSLVPTMLGGVRQYVQLTHENVAGVAARDGKLLWRAPRKEKTAVITTPVVQGDMVYVTSFYGAGCNMFKVTQAGGAFSAEQVYANKVMSNHHGGVIAVGDYVYGYSDGKGWVCQELATGKAVWEEKSMLGKGALAFADGCFYLRQEDKSGPVALIEASPSGYKERGRFDPPERSEKNAWTHPVIAGERLYLRDQDVLLCYQLTSP